MLSLSTDNPVGFQNSGMSILVLRLASNRLEIGFGSLPPASQASIQTLLESGLSLELTVWFPQSGATGICKVSLLGGAAGKLLRAFSLDLLAPYDFGGLVYDPLGSMAASLARLATDGPDRPSWHGECSQPNDGLMALWAALEADLYRFAKDSGFTAAVDAAAVEQAYQYRRFARLNELYRDLVKLLVPYGLAPRRWTAWLLGQEYQPVLPRGLAVRICRILEGRTRQPEVALDCLTRLLVRHEALIMLEHD